MLHPNHELEPPAKSVQFKLVRSYGLKQECITPHCLQQNGMMERLIRSLKKQYGHRHRFASLEHASRAIGDWI
ncbi:MAG: integrase core domain-containing protein [Pseudomonadota bacterium]